MSSETWPAVRNALGTHSLELGPYFAYQVLNTPRHLLFTLSRYKFASRLLPQDRSASVLELGSGEGLGTRLLGEAARSVLGVDSDEPAIAYAQQHLASETVQFKAADILTGTFGTFDAVVSLDVIEHIEQAHEAKLMRVVCDCLTADGFAVIGTPNVTASQYASKFSEIGHINLFTAERLRSLMGTFFRNVFMFGMNDEVVHTGFYPMCHYLFALGCGKRAV